MLIISSFLLVGILSSLTSPFASLMMKMIDLLGSSCRSVIFDAEQAGLHLRGPLFFNVQTSV